MKRLPQVLVEWNGSTTDTLCISAFLSAVFFFTVGFLRYLTIIFNGFESRSNCTKKLKPSWHFVCVSILS